MHDPTEGGVATALHELAWAAGVGLRVRSEDIPGFPETQALCNHYHLDPLGLIASGALLIVVPSAEAGVFVLARLGHAAISGNCHRRSH